MTTFVMQPQKAQEDRREAGQNMAQKAGKKVALVILNSRLVISIRRFTFLSLVAPIAIHRHRITASGCRHRLRKRRLKRISQSGILES